MKYTLIGCGHGLVVGAMLLAALGLFGAQTGWAQDDLRAELGNVPDKILFEHYANDNWDLFVMKADGSDPTNLTQTPDVHEMYPQASVDGTKIAFELEVSQGDDTLRSVYYMNADGTGRKLVSDKARQPCWSPDGKRIAFLKQEFDKFNVMDFASKGIYFYDLATGEITEHPNTEICHLYNMSWAPDGKWIVSTVHAGMGFSHAIIAIEVDGLGVYSLGVPGCRPCVSPDGRKLTWSPGDKEIGIADLDFSGDAPKAMNIRVLHQEPVLHTYHPDFSPDSKYVTFSVGPGGRTPANGPGTHTNVAEIVGVRGKWNLFVKRANGEGEALQLTDDEGAANKESDWLPVSASPAVAR